MEQQIVLLFSIMHAAILTISHLLSLTHQQTGHSGQANNLVPLQTEILKYVFNISTV
jgi:hypothetical protein